MAARNPSLEALSNFLLRPSPAFFRSTVSYIKIIPERVLADAGPFHQITCTELVQKVSELEATSGLVAIIENLRPEDVETLGSAWDIDPFFFCGHIASSYQVVEDGPPPPLMALPPSRIASQEYFNLHYQKVLDLGAESILTHLPYKLGLPANIPRIVRRLPGLSGRAIGLVRSCCSVLKKRMPGGIWICLILVDPTTADLVARKPGNDAPFEDLRVRIPQAPRRINVEDFCDLPTYSTFRSSGSAKADTRDPNMREDLLRLLQVPPPDWDADDPDILSLVYYPIKIVLAEWMLYGLVMGRYVKFYEYSLQAARPWASHFEQADVLELHRWRRRSQQSLHKIRMMRRFVEHWGERHPPAPPGTWQHLLVGDLQHLEQQIELHARALEILNPINTALVQLLDSRKSISQAEDVKRLSLVALVFIPLSYVTGIFSMADRYAPGSERFWVYWATAVPIAVVVLCFTFLTGRIPELVRWVHGWRECAFKAR
ncbi:uncharacterized protein BO95DRAFT_441227 [Aspergillus brunneoviolaceus CBS 621.78]|uniref:Uncharacterized protein n=1 Tax=Aspergillus brunneoviolaceus CBS 621.78 TaxID=1450534 RepID=A0ACD1GE01_9EURO|nr:hypothetical protein BO95DRAFT_441227 [Aspergillus brunneoviolaceus CBS 621.78]RAH47403.1 hypothetical protein BO95DRAFT_441227 [Aspergillus brunneoviolaceus CBS 621.78]